MDNFLSEISSMHSFPNICGYFSRWPKLHLGMEENEITKIIVDICYKIHSTLGPGLFESVYETILCIELSDRGIKFERQKEVPVYWNGKKIDIGFRSDLIIEDKIILEIKSVETILPVHKKQLITYLRLMDKRLGLLINFNSNLIKDGITRIANNF